MTNQMTKKATESVRKQNVSKIFNYIKLQTKLSFKSTGSQKLSRKIINIVLAIFVYALFLTLSYFLFRDLVTQTTFIQGPDIAILIFSITQLIILIASVLIQCKRLYKPDDLTLILTFPLTSFQKYVGEVATIYIKLLIRSAMFVYPFLIVYGVAGGMISTDVGASCVYIFASLFATLLLPLLPFSFSLIISVPFMYLGDWLRNKNITKLIIFIVIFVGLLVFYALILNFMADWWIHAATNVEVVKAIAGFLSAINKPYNFAFFTSEICLGHQVLINLAILLGISIAFMAIGVLITKPLYQKFISSANLLETAAIVKKTQLTEYNTYSAIFIKEFKQIVRTQTYAFFYLGVAFSMPILTFLTTDLIKTLGQAQTGTHVFFGFAMLILCIIISLIGSYSANVISKEGTEFYLTKVVPLSYRKQLMAKAMVNFCVSFIGLILCIVVLGATATTTYGLDCTLSVGDLFVLFGITTLFLIGITFNGININLVRPKIEMKNGQPNESNVIIQLVIGILITAILSVFVIVSDGILGSSSIYGHLIIMGIMLLYALINFLIFFFSAEKKYIRIEGK